MENMTSKELKEMAKELKVKNWWNLKKSELIAEIKKIRETEEPQNAPECTEEVEADNNKPETENAAQGDSEEPEHRTIKKPNLKIKELTFNGKTQTIKAWAAELEMPWPTLYDRINRNGWTVEEALTIPLGGRRKK